jgi:apolipoprotein N-acyltransferase
VFVNLRTFYTIAFLSGAALPLAFAPFNIWIIAILSPAALLWIWQSYFVWPREAFWSGFFYGLGMFSVGISWVFISIHRYGNTEIPLAVGLTSLLVIGLSLFIAIQGYVLKKFFRGSSTAFLLYGFPSCWVLFEWIRGWIFTGFPWLYLGYTQLTTPLGGYAPIFSVYGVSLAVALNSSLLVALIFGAKKMRITAMTTLILLWGIGFFLHTQQYTTASTRSYTASLIQSNVKPSDKYTQPEPLDSVEKLYGGLTESAWGSDIILWPEGAIPVPLPISKPYIDNLQVMAGIYHSTLISGIINVDQAGHYFNSLIAIGNGSGTYHKQHLLPFGDYVPFQTWLRGFIDFFDLPMSSFSSGPAEQSLLHAGDLLLDPLICYEIAFPTLVRTTLRNANAIITLSEDGWFGESLGPHQHLQIAQMRALETGRYVLRATTSGLTAIIDNKGRITAMAPPFQATALKGSFQSMTGETPWVILGLWPLLILLWAAFIGPRYFSRTA